MARWVHGTMGQRRSGANARPCPMHGTVHQLHADERELRLPARRVPTVARAGAATGARSCTGDIGAADLPRCTRRRCRERLLAGASRSSSGKRCGGDRLGRLDAPDATARLGRLGRARETRRDAAHDRVVSQFPGTASASCRATFRRHTEEQRPGNSALTRLDDSQSWQLLVEPTPDAAYALPLSTTSSLLMTRMSAPRRLGRHGRAQLRIRQAVEDVARGDHDDDAVQAVAGHVAVSRDATQRRVSARFDEHVRTVAGACAKLGQIGRQVPVVVHDGDFPIVLLRDEVFQERRLAGTRIARPRSSVGGRSISGSAVATRIENSARPSTREGARRCAEDARR